jgi:hypothetical protein
MILNINFWLSVISTMQKCVRFYLVLQNNKEVIIRRGYKERLLMEIELIVIVSNTLVVFATFLATLYRIKIERDQVQTVKKDVKAKECLDSLRKYVRTERTSLINMNEEELKEFIEYLEKLGKC